MLSNVTSFLSVRDALLLEQSHRCVKLGIAWRELACHCIGDDCVTKRGRQALAKGVVLTNLFWREFCRERVQNTPPVVVAIYKVTNQAGDLVNMGCADDSLYQVQLDHKSRRSVATGIASVFLDFVRRQRMKHNGMLGNFKLVVSDGVDPNGVGYKRFRAAFYIVGNEAFLLRFTFLLLEFVEVVARWRARGPFDVHIYPHASIHITDIDNDYVFCHAPALDLPMGIFEAMPVVGRRIVTMTLCPQGDDTIALVLSGNLWTYRDRLDAIGAIGSWQYDGESDESRTYCHTLQVNLHTGEMDRVWNMLGDSVFKGLAIRVIVQADLVTNMNVHAFVSDMRARPQLHFV